MTEPAESGFTVRLRNFEGPFDLLLQLISSRRLDVTDVALGVVTDEFIAYTKELGAEAGLDEVTEFLVVAATLLDLKAARLLPSGDVEDPEDLALLEARDLLFARLLQYRAYKRVAERFAEWEAGALRRYPRAVSPEPWFADLLPEVDLGVDVSGFAEVAAAAFRPRAPETVGTAHIHAQAVSVPEQARKLLALLRLAGPESWLTFAQLTRGTEISLEVVGRFLALLELYKARAIEFDQEECLGELRVRWSGDEVDDAVIGRDDWEG